MPILLYGLEAVPISNANLATLQSTLNMALFKIFTVNDAANLLYLQYCNNTLPINYMLDTRKFKFLFKQSSHINFTVKSLYLLHGHKEFDALCDKYPVSDHRSKSRPTCRHCIGAVWNVFTANVLQLH